MDPELARHIHAGSPKLNLALARGLASSQCTNADKYIYDLLYIGAKKLSTTMGFKFKDLQRASPEEEVRQVLAKVDEKTGKCGSKKSFDLAHSSIYMVRLVFEYQGRDLIHYIQMPYIEDAGEYWYQGVKFTVSPVIADKVISVSLRNVFLALEIAKLTFHQLDYNFYVNFNLEDVKVVWAKVYNRKKGAEGKPDKIKSKVKAPTTMGHYLFCKYGVTGTFGRFAGANVVIGNPDTVNPDTHPMDEWVIMSSWGKKPMKRTYDSNQYEPSGLRIAVRVEEYTGMVKNLAGCFFYVVDHFPDTMTLDKVEDCVEWRILLGKLIWSDAFHVGRLRADVENHFVSTDSYLGHTDIKRFNDLGMEIEDLYQFFAWLIDNFTNQTILATKDINSLYNKELTVLFYLFTQYRYMINKMYFGLTRSESKGKMQTFKEVEQTVRKWLKTGLVQQIHMKNGEVDNRYASGDNMAFKITANMVPQEKTTKGLGSNDNANLSDPTRRLHVSFAELAGYAAVQKADPSGKTVINHWMNVDQFGRFVRHPDLIDLLDNVQSQL